jgi:hypothetical protein
MPSEVVEEANLARPRVGVIADKDISHIIAGNEDIAITITKKTTQAQLDEFINQMKAKGVKLQFDNVEFDNGKLVLLSGSMKANGSESNFTVTDFEKVILAMINKNGQTYFKVNVQDKKEVI